MHPDASFVPGRGQSRRNFAQPLREAFPILTFAQHLQQPVGRADDGNDCEKQAVEQIHDQARLF